MPGVSKELVDVNTLLWMDFISVLVALFGWMTEASLLFLKYNEKTAFFSVRVSVVPVATERVDIEFNEILHTCLMAPNLG